MGGGGSVLSSILYPLYQFKISQPHGLHVHSEEFYQEEGTRIRKHVEMVESHITLVLLLFK